MIGGRRSLCLAGCCVARSLLLCCSFGNNEGILKPTAPAFAAERQAVMGFGSSTIFQPIARGKERGVRFVRAVAAVEDGKEDGERGSAPRPEKLVLDRPVDRVVLSRGRGLRVHCLSDLHTDYKSNMAWLKTWPSWKGSEAGDLGEGHEDVLLVAGDVSSSLDRSAETLAGLKERYDQVFFVVGNHDLWAARRQRWVEEDSVTAKQAEDGGSVVKLVQVHRLCEELGVRVNPAVFVLGGGVEGRGARDKGKRIEEVGVFPLLSWYHSSWDHEPDLPEDDQFRNGDFFRRWGDYAYCRWPAGLCSREEFVTLERDAPPVLADFFARQNDACIAAFRAGRDEEQDEDEEEEKERTGGKTAAVAPAAPAAPDRTVISFSHFVPRQELCPEKRFLSEPNLTKVIGSAPLERQIRELGSDLHVFGHTHIPLDMGCDGVRYLQWPLGSVSEQSRQCQRMREQGPLLVYSHDGEKGGLAPPVQTFWGDHYRTHARDVEETYVPEWALKRIRGRRRAKAPPGADPAAE